MQTKIKYVIWNLNRETVNCWAVVTRVKGGYRLDFDDGVSFDSCAKFDPIKRRFYSD